MHCINIAFKYSLIGLYLLKKTLRLCLRNNVLNHYFICLSVKTCTTYTRVLYGTCLWFCHAYSVPNLFVVLSRVFCTEPVCGFVTSVLYGNCLWFCHACSVPNLFVVLSRLFCTEPVCGFVLHFIYNLVYILIHIYIAILSYMCYFNLSS